MFDFGHVKSHEEMKEVMQTIIKSADETNLRLALKIIRAVSRWLLIYSVLSLPFFISILYNVYPP